MSIEYFGTGLRPPSHQVDILAFDAQENPILLAEVKAREDTGEAEKEQLLYYLTASRIVIPFAMSVNSKTITLFSWDGKKLKSLLQLATPDVLSFYDPEFTNKRVFEYYLTGLIEAWLRDVAYHWKSDSPPYYSDLSKAGFAERLYNGTTVSEALLP